MLNDSDKNIMAELAHESCASHCEDCGECLYDDEPWCQDCEEDEGHDLFNCSCSACDETRAERRSDGMGWSNG